MAPPTARHSPSFITSHNERSTYARRRPCPSASFPWLASLAWWRCWRWCARAGPTIHPSRSSPQSDGPGSKVSRLPLVCWTMATLLGISFELSALFAWEVAVRFLACGGCGRAEFRLTDITHVFDIDNSTVVINSLRDNPRCKTRSRHRSRCASIDSLVSTDPSKRSKLQKLAFLSPVTCG